MGFLDSNYVAKLAMFFGVTITILISGFLFTTLCWALAFKFWHTILPWLFR